MDTETTIERITEWVKEEGAGAVVIALIQSGITPDMAAKIAAGRYKSEPRHSLNHLLRKALEQRQKAS